MATARLFRFYKQGSKLNYNGEIDKDVTYNTLVSGDLFALGESNPACQIGILTLPGTKFYLNSGVNTNNAIIVGITGIYELNTENIGINITGLRFDGLSIRNINNEDGAYLIVDIIYLN